MNRRRFVMTTVAGCAALSVPALQRAGAQESTPVAGGAIQNVRWELQQIEMGDGSVLTPNDPANYWIQFGTDGRAYISADCNRAGGPYTLNGSELTFGNLFSTMALCPEDSISTQFLAMLDQVVTFVISTDASDQLALNMAMDSGNVYFQPVLQGVTWQWVEFQGSDGSVTTVDDPTRYTIDFLEDDSVQVLADCNRGFGDATIDGNSISLIIGTTRMMCPEDSQSDDFLLYLDQAVSWVIRDGMLALAQPADAGIALFQPLFVVETEPEAEATPAM